MLLALALVTGGVLAGICAFAAAALAMVGLMAERWLMFAEATHTVALYYGADARG